MDDPLGDAVPWSSGPPAANSHRTHTDHERILDAIYAWRDGASYDAVHPLERWRDAPGYLYVFSDENAMKDLARVISHTLAGDKPPHPGEPAG